MKHELESVHEPDRPEPDGPGDAESERPGHPPARVARRDPAEAVSTRLDGSLPVANSDLIDEPPGAYLRELRVSGWAIVWGLAHAAAVLLVVVEWRVDGLRGESSAPLHLLWTLAPISCLLHAVCVIGVLLVGRGARSRGRVILVLALTIGTSLARFALHEPVGSAFDASPREPGAAQEASAAR